MSRFLSFPCAALLTFAVWVTPAAAQAPDAELFALGVDLGAQFPDTAFEKTLTLDAIGEYYLSPRVSVRGLLGWASPGFENRTEDHFRQFMLLFNGVYNWDVGTSVFPYVTAGAGAYFVRELLDGLNDPDSETRGGINFGGGAELFVGDLASVKAEVRWDVVSHPTGLPDASSFSLTFGYKRYF